VDAVAFIDLVEFYQQDIKSKRNQVINGKSCYRLWLQSLWSMLYVSPIQAIQNNTNETALLYIVDI